LAFNRFRNRQFPDLASMLSEPVWDMVLQLFVATVQGTGLSLTELEKLCNIAHSTAFRYKNALVEAAWIEQHAARGDARKASLYLKRERKAQLLDFFADEASHFRLPPIEI
jgi:DNA-binding IclR family transcriptional regulator